MYAINRAGNFRGFPIKTADGTKKWAVQKSKNGATCWYAEVQLVEEWNGETWVELNGNEFCYVNVYFITTQGKVSESGVKQLSEALLWDGDTVTLNDFDWSDTPVQLSVKQEEYQGKTQFKFGWLSHYNDKPGGGAIDSVGDDGLKNIATQFGSQLRAFCGERPAPPSGAPTPPKRPEMVAAPTGDSIPFNGGSQ